MACRTNGGQDILSVIETLMNDTDLLKRFVQGESDETVPLGEPVATPTPTLRHLAKNVMDAIDYFQSNLSFNADPLQLDSYAFNVRRSRVMPDDVPAGSIVTLPVTYYPERDILLVMYRGEICTPRKQDDWNPGERQYEEIAGPDVPSGGSAANYPSNKILVSFDMNAGSSLDCWVVASNLMREMAALIAARDVAIQAAETATEQATIATEERETIQAMIGDTILELGVANIRASFRATQDYAVGDTMTLPVNYYPKRAVLVVTYKGQICTPYKLGGGDFYSYHEVGTDPTVEVNQIVLDFPVATGDPFDIMVWASSVGRNIDVIVALAAQVKTDASNAVLASQSVFNKADKYYVTSGTPSNFSLRNLSVGSVVSLLDFTTAGLPGDSTYSGTIAFTDGEHLTFDVDDEGKTRFALYDAGDNPIQLFYAESSGWVVTGNWQFLSPKTVASALDGAVPSGPSLWDTVVGSVAAAFPVDCQYNYLNKPERDELQSVLTDANYGTTTSTVTVTVDVYNALTKTVSQVQRTFPLASALNPGAMPAEAYSALSQALVDIDFLKQQGGRFIGQSFPTKAALDAYVFPSTVNIGDFTFVEVDETQGGAVTRYIVVDDGSGGKEFAFGYILEAVPVGLANDSQAGLVQSAPADGANGKVFVELNGTMSVLGWDTQTVNIANNATAIANLESQINQIHGVEFGATAPAATGNLWVNTSDFCLYYNNGTSWVRLTGVYQENAGA